MPSSTTVLNPDSSNRDRVGARRQIGDRGSCRFRCDTVVCVPAMLRAAHGHGHARQDRARGVPHDPEQIARRPLRLGNRHDGQEHEQRRGERRRYTRFTSSMARSLSVRSHVPLFAVPSDELWRVYNSDGRRCQGVSEDCIEGRTERMPCTASADMPNGRCSSQRYDGRDAGGASSASAGIAAEMVAALVALCGVASCSASRPARRPRATSSSSPSTRCGRTASECTAAATSRPGSIASRARGRMRPTRWPTSR